MSSPEMAESSGGPSNAAPQATRSCRLCYEKKLKCDASGSHPCSRCTETGTTCERRTRKQYPARRRPAEKIPPVSVPVAPFAISESNKSASVGDAKAFADAVVNSRHQPERGATDPVFAGDRQGIGSLLDVTLPDGQNHVQHLLVPRAAAKLLSNEDLEYLKQKGCFSIPGSVICNQLLNAYMQYLHPTFPIIDAHAFTATVTGKGLQGVNLLLLWSILATGTSFVDDKLVAQAGFGTKADMKETYLKRAKTLFHLSEEEDKIVLLQSALLISFWFRDPSDIAQSWYWSGIAISLAQTIGLHRNPDAGGHNMSISNSRRWLWRRLWWSCVLRDSWLALGMGRPLRINDQDCDCPPPAYDDHSLRSDANSDFAGSDSENFDSPFIELIRLTKLLRQVLVLDRKYHSAVPSSSIELLEYQIRQCVRPEALQTQTQFAQFQVLHLQLHQEATLIALFRPCLADFVPSPRSQTSDIGTGEARDRITASASKIHGILESIIAMNASRFFGPQSIALLVPAMQSHLSELKSTNLLTTAMAKSRLDLCLSILDSMEHNYPAASIVKQLFSLAMDKISSSTEKPVPRADPERTLAEEHSFPVMSVSSKHSDQDPSTSQTPANGPLVWQDISLFTPPNDFWPSDSIASTLSLEHDINALLDFDGLEDFVRQI